MKVILLIALFQIVYPAYADDSMSIPENPKGIFSHIKTNMTGFITQQVVKTTSNNVAGNSSKLSFDKREIGIQNFCAVNQYLDFRGMAVYSKYGNRYSNAPHIEFGLADLHLNDDVYDYSVGARLGRVRLTMGLYNDTRINPGLRDLDFAPQALYRDQWQNTATSGDGVQLYASKKYDNCTINVEVSRVIPRIDTQDDAVNVMFSTPNNFGIFENNTVTSFHASLNANSIGTIFKYDRIGLKYQYTPSSISFIPAGNLNTTIEYFSIRKYFNYIDLTGEYLQVTRNAGLWDVILNNTNYGSPRAFNFSARLKLPRTTISAGYNVWFTDISNRSGDQHASLTGVSAPRYYSKDLNIGIKYVINNNWIIKAEAHRMQGTNTLSIIENPNMNALTPNWNLYSSSITYMF